MCQLALLSIRDRVRFTWTRITKLASTLALTSTTVLLRQILLRHLREQLLFVATTQDVDLRNSDGIKELFDNAEDT